MAQIVEHVVPAPPCLVVRGLALGDERVAVEVVAEEFDLLERLATDVHAVAAEHRAADDHQCAADVRAGR